MTTILVSFLISLGVNGAFFAVAAIRKTDVVTDLSYSLTFAVVTITLLVAGGAPVTTQVVLAVFVLVWAVRLGAYLFRRILTIKVDHRFDGMRERPLRFARFWLLQAISVGIIMLPVTYALGHSNPPDLDPWVVLGGIVWLVGLIIEWVSDEQKYAFKCDPERRDGFIDSGLWRYSRHPNYFGEMLVWWGVFVCTMPFLSGLSYLVVIGPIFITVLLLFVSGVPLLEKSAETRHGADPAYQEYKRRTSLLVPLPPRAEGSGRFRR
jgi:steroid 5-alpha reductase family enzyme